MTGQAEDKVRIGVNLLVLTDRPPGGTGYHAISLFEALVEAEQDGTTRAQILGFAAGAAAQHFSPAARERLVMLPPGRGWRRALNEWVRLPLAARRAGITWMINPAFFGAPWGSPKRALIIHDLYFRSVPHLVPSRRRVLLRAVMPLLGARSDIIFTVSNATRTELARFYPGLAKRTLLLPSGNRALLSPGDQRTERDDRPAPPRSAYLPAQVRQPYLLMVGHLTANKSPQTVVAAMAALNQVGRDLTLVHVGDDAGRLGPLGTEMCGPGDIVALGPQPDRVLAACYEHCTALVIPSIREGFGLPLIEAQAHGAPVIASSCDALMEVGGDAALYFPVGSVTACAEAISLVLDNAVTRDRLIERGYANAARFRWDRTARLLLEHIGLAAVGSGAGGQSGDQ